MTNDERHQSDKSLADFAVWGFIIAFAVIFSLLALNRHAAFQSHGFDLGNVNQAVWNTAHGRPLAFTNMAPLTNRLAVHVEPVYFLLVPFYWLGIGGPEFLLAVQAFVVGLGAWPLYLIAKPKIGAAGAVLVSLAYLLYPALEAAVLFDVHAVTFAPTFLLFTFYYLERYFEAQEKRSTIHYSLFTFHFLRASLFIVLALACKEDMGLVVAMLGLYFGLTARRWKPALVIIAIGAGWTLVALFVVQPMFAAGGNIQSDRYTWLFENLTQPSVIRNHLWQQADLPGYLWGLLAPVGGLALLAPAALLPALPSLAINLLSSHPLQWRPESFHYAAPMAPFVFLAAVLGIQRLTGWMHKLRITNYELRIVFAVVVFLASLIYHHYRGFTPLARPFQWQPVTAHHQLGAEMAAVIPGGIPLFAPLNLNPHVSSRTVLHQDFDDIAPDDWLWLDVASLPNENGVQQYIRDELLPRTDTVWAADGYLLLKPPNSPFAIHHSPFDKDFHAFAQPDPDFTPQYSLSVVFGDSLELVGYDLRLNRAEEVQVVTYWRALKPLPAGVSPVLFAVDKAGTPFGATPGTLFSPTMVWFPPDQWPVGEVVSVAFNRVMWTTLDRETYGLGIGVSTGEDVWDVGARLRPEVRQTRFANRLPADGTIMELAQFQRVAGFSEGGPVARQMRRPVMEHRLAAVFGEQIALVGHSAPEITEDGVRIELLWQGVGETRGNVVRFVHVVGPDGQLAGQMDSVPVNGTYPASLWANGEYVTDAVTIPLGEMPVPGNYVLHIGFYDPASGQRLVTPAGDDHVEVVFRHR